MAISSPQLSSSLSLPPVLSLPPATRLATPARCYTRHWSCSARHHLSYSETSASDPAPHFLDVHQGWGGEALLEHVGGGCKR
jgi:hypothetical protein